MPDFFPMSMSLKTAVLGLTLAVALLPPAFSYAAETTLADYRIAIGDVLEFDFLDDPELPRQVTVGSGGSAQIPLLGPVRVEGLTIEAALTEVKGKFVSSNLLVDPNVTLAIATFRAVYVLGDVRAPGAFPFQASMTVERAIGLAGGLIADQSNTEDRVILRSRLEGNLARLDGEIAREAVWSGRLTAQLEGRETVDLADLPQEARPFLKQTYVDHFLKIENRILGAELTAYASQASILSLNITESKKQLDLLDKLRVNQEEAIQFTKEAVNRASKLRKSGLNTADDMANVQRQLNTDEGRMLQILAELAGGQRQIAALQQQLSGLRDNRARDTLIQMQERNTVLNALTVDYRSTQEQLALAGNWASAVAASKLQSVISFTIRQRSGSPGGDVAAVGTTNVLPGDVIIVSIAKPDPAELVQIQ